MAFQSVYLSCSLLQGSPSEVLNSLKARFEACKNDKALSVLAEMSLFFEYVSDMLGNLDQISFDVRLARGLDYYTGVIFEVVLQGTDVGSVCGGGRYDNLVGMFSGRKIPAVGFALGIERIFRVLEDRDRSLSQKETSAHVRVVVAGQNPRSERTFGTDPLLLRERLKICSELWNAGIRVCSFLFRLS